MKRPQSTTGIGDGTGSTEPEPLGQRLEHEAARIRDWWRSQNWETGPAPTFDSACLCRHKSLVIHLAMEDYARACQSSDVQVVLSEHCRKYEGLSEPLEHSIVRQLEVQEFFNENRDEFPVSKLFEWPEPGDAILHLRVLEELGRGAMARVYLCEQIKLGDKSAVVKIVLGESVTEPALLGKLQHANITPIHWADYDPAIGASFLCMPFLGRSTLADLIQLAFQDGLPRRAGVVDRAARLWLKESDTRRFEAENTNGRRSTDSSYVTRIIDIGAELASALTFMHSKQVIHGDIKPSNVLLSPTGRPFLLDFNLGRIRDAAVGPAGGTPAYMAPEQLRAIVEQSSPSTPGSDVATDIYSFGALIYELLAGRPPHVPSDHMGDVKGIACDMLRLQQSGFTSVDELNPDVDRQLSKLISGCLAIDPAKRPATMRDVANHLSECRSYLNCMRRYVKQKPIRTAALTLAIAGSISGASLVYISQPPLTQRLFSQAIAAQEDGDLPRSVELYRQVLTTDPTFPGARLARARCFNQLGDYASAHSDLLQLVRTSQEPAIQAYFAYSLNLMENADAAVLWYQEALNNGLRSAAVFNNLGISCLLQSKPRSYAEKVALASPLFEEALKLMPDSATIRRNMLLMYHMRLSIDAEASIAAAAEHITWLSRELPNRTETWECIHSFYATLAEIGLVEKSEVLAALEMCRNATEDAPIPKFLDPL